MLVDVLNLIEFQSRLRGILHLHQNTYHKRVKAPKGFNPDYAGFCISTYLDGLAGDTVTPDTFQSRLRGILHLHGLYRNPTVAGDSCFNPDYAGFCISTGFYACDKLVINGQR